MLTPAWQPGPRNVEAGAGLQSSWAIHTQFEASLGYVEFQDYTVRPCLKTENESINLRLNPQDHCYSSPGNLGCLVTSLGGTGTCFPLEKGFAAALGDCRGLSGMSWAGWGPQVARAPPVPPASPPPPRPGSGPCGRGMPFPRQYQPHQVTSAAPRP